ncbi:hypothetical protein ACTHGU_17240 [Chitinophagaceae bacterium MMS25-I14]
MKKLTLFVGALLIAGATFAHDGGKDKACCKKGEKKEACCKKGEKKACCKKGESKEEAKAEGTTQKAK